MMDYQAFLAKIIETGVKGAHADYAKPEDARKLRGSLDGFEACRGKSPREISVLLAEARTRVTLAYGGEDIEHYWELVCLASEIEWTANVISAALLMEGQPTIVTPTYRGILHAYRLLGGAAA